VSTARNKKLARALERFLDHLQRSADGVLNDPMRALSGAKANGLSQPEKGRAAPAELQAVESVCELSVLEKEMVSLATPPDERELLRRAVKDLRAYAGPMVAMLKDSPALDYLGPVLGAVRIIGWFSGPIEIGRKHFEGKRAAKMRANKAAKRRAADDARDEAIKRYAGGKKRARVKEIVQHLKAELGEPVRRVHYVVEGPTLSERTVKRRLSKLELVRKKKGRS
jgi:hypothetical protein